MLSITSGPTVPVPYMDVETEEVSLLEVSLLLLFGMLLFVTQSKHLRNTVLDEKMAL